MAADLARLAGRHEPPRAAIPRGARAWLAATIAVTIAAAGGGHRAGTARSRACTRGSGVLAVRRLVSACGLDRLVLHRAGRSRAHARAQTEVPVVAARADNRGRRDRPAGATHCPLLAAAALFRLAVLPLSEAEPRHRRPCCGFSADRAAADGRAPGADRRGPGGDRRPAGAAEPAPAAGAACPGDLVPAGGRYVRRLRRRRGPGASPGGVPVSGRPDSALST